MKGYFSFLVFLFLVNSTVFANFSVNVTPGYVSGHNTYEIGGEVEEKSGNIITYHFPFSKLKFPVTGTTAQLGVKSTLFDRIILEGEASRFISMGSIGKMEDSDYALLQESTTNTDRVGELDLFSSSDTKLAHYSFFIKGLFQFAQTDRSNWYMGIGHYYQNFDYYTYNTHQQPVSDYAITQGYFITLSPQKTLTYNSEFNVPYFLLKWQRPNKFDSVLVGFSPLVSVEDIDVHLDRTPIKISIGSLNGISYYFSGNLHGPTYKDFRSLFTLNYLYLNAKGKQRQFFSDAGDPTFIVDEEVTASILSIHYTLSYDF